MQMWLLCLSLCIVSAQQNAVLIALPSKLAAQGFDPALVGAIGAIPPLFTLAARLPGGLLYRPSWTAVSVFVSYVAMAATSALFAGAVTPAHFSILGALNGLFGGVLTTLLLPLFLETVPVSLSKPRAMGWYTGSVALGFAAGGYFAGYGADHWGFGIVFHGAAASTVVGLLALAAGMAGRNPAPRAAARAASPSAWQGRARHLLAPDVIFVLLTAVFLNVLYKLPATFLPVQAHASGMAFTDVGLLMGVYALCNAIVRPISGPLIERLGVSRTSAFGLPAQAAVVMLIAVLSQLGPLLGVIVVAGTLRAVVMVSNAASMTEAMDERRFSKGMASGLFNAAGDLGYVIGPLFGGLLADLVGLPRMFLLAPALVAACYFAMLATVRRALRWRVSR